jgi:UDP-N-acetylmuramoyl-L-alanyl-D-glutamate--2,6-diaminopimelate ligase
MEKILRSIEKLIPKKLYRAGQPIYHYLLALAGAILYRFPSRRIKVIAITGTKGKTSTTEILAKILETAGYKVATTSTLQFKIGDKIRRNLYKMSMPGRMFMQKFLREAVAAGCDFAILETTSEGAKTFRHKFIDFNGLIFTNISPEHIEAHGSFEKYLEAKLEYAIALEKSSKKNKTLVANADDVEAGKFFQRAPSAKQISFTLHDAEPFEISENESRLTIDGEKINTKLPGKFNLYNILGAAKMARVFGVSALDIKKAIESLDQIRGRMEKVSINLPAQAGNPRQNFEVIVDYAHTADSLAQAYEALGGKHKICILGSCGGGRDEWKRPQMGQVADKYCDVIILTNEDPYDEDPHHIICDVAKGITKDHLEIFDRREAIAKAISLATPGSAVIITGKGTDPYIMGPNGSRQEWDDATVVREELTKFFD